MRKNILSLLLTFMFSICYAQTYKYIGVDEGLSNSRVHAIQKGPKGYMWFLTHNGIDRYDGKNFKHYKLIENNIEINSILNLSWLYVGNQGSIWVIGKKGRVFHYDTKHDDFKFVYKLPDEIVKSSPSPVSYGFIDSNNTVWLCNKETLYLYDTNKKKTTIENKQTSENITSIVEIDSENFLIGTDAKIYHVEVKNNVLTRSGFGNLDSLHTQVTHLYHHKESNKVVIGTFKEGVYIFDITNNKLTNPNDGLEDVSISSIKAFRENEILIATDGAGVHKMNILDYKCEPYIVADYQSHNGMNGNGIYDIFVDGDHIWLANYPIGITLRNDQHPKYKWIKHSVGYSQSLVNDHVNAIVEDQDGDLWFATKNGVSFYNSTTKQWKSFLSTFDNVDITKNHVFMSICEVSPGIIWAGGHSFGIFQIDKKRMKAELIDFEALSNSSIRMDKYIRSITKTLDGNVWSGGIYNLKEIDLTNKKIRLYPELSGVTDIKEMDEKHVWIGTTTGLNLLNRETGQHQLIKLPIESFYINTIYQDEKGLLYIGTSNFGLLIYDHKDKSFVHYHRDNSALISNNIYSILPSDEKYILLGTENGITGFYPETKNFHNWTKEQGLKSDHFISKSGTLRKNGNFIFGSTNGAIEFDQTEMFPREYRYQMKFSDLWVFYKTVYPGDENSPLTVDIDETSLLKLKYNQSTFSLKVSSINFDYPSLLLYSWKLENFYDGWSTPEKDCVIQFTNLNPGKYTLKVRTVSSEDRRLVLEERSMDIIIEKPYWLSVWAILFYILVVIGIVAFVFRIINLRKQRIASDEKIRFFINTAHDIRTPLTLIKAPLEELCEKENLTPAGRNNTNTALRNVNALLRLATNLINFERVDTYSGTLYLSEYELSTYLNETINSFQPYADVKHITLTYESNFRFVNIWFDKDKMDSILKNLISNALKYTPEGGSVTIYAADSEESWSVEVKDTGIGIPASEQKRLFKLYFRGSNAINSKVSGSGIGLLLVRKLVILHKGKISFNSTEGKGSCVKISFPKKEKSYRRAIRSPKVDNENMVFKGSGTTDTSTPASIYEGVKLQQQDESLPKILIVDDNDELREYLRNTLSDSYNIQVCNDGKPALSIVKEYMPNIIISDVMMPEMRGDELCQILKNDIETSHIPIILLTALNNDRNIIEGLNTGADEYIVKPFNIGILRATIANILTNRSLLRRKYASLDLNEEEEDSATCTNCSTDLDWKFISSVKKSVEENMDNPAFNVDMLCSLHNMSRTSFYNKIKALTDQAPADYIRLIKLKRATQLLKEGQHTITEIAEMTGFNDAKYFREVFKKHYNVSPSQYAKQNKES